MKALKITLLALILSVVSYPQWEYSIVDEAIYDLVTDCNGYYPLTAGHGQSCN